MESSKKIIGREKEIEKLNLILGSNKSEFLAVYGRRRVGKTFLIRQSLKEKIVFDFTGAKDASLKGQLKNFFSVYLNQTKGKKETTVPKTWFEAFGYLVNYLSSLKSSKTKHVVFIDEMPWLDTPKSGFVSALEYFWNQHAVRLENVVLVACGSSSSWIRKNLIKARGGLYNRVTQRMKLSPFTLYETELFLKSKKIDMPRYQILELYMAMGGIPFYLDAAVQGQSATQAIDQTCFSKGGLLYDEYAQLYYAIFRNAEFHVAIIEALASQPQGLSRNDIKGVTGLSEASLTRALEELLESDFIISIPPLLNKKKETMYKLIDLYSLFYLKFQRLSGSNGWDVLSNKPSYAAWSGYAYENICLLHTVQIKRALGIENVQTQQCAWRYQGDEVYPGAQIDLVIDRADNCINICEVKFTKDTFGLSKAYAEKIRLKKSVFKYATATKKAVFTTLITTFPALKNLYFQEEIDNSITMDKLFTP